MSKNNREKKKKDVYKEVNKMIEELVKGQEILTKTKGFIVINISKADITIKQ